MIKIALYQARDVARSRWLAAYALFFFASAEALIRFQAGDARALLSLANIVLYLVPLVTVVFGTVYVYGSREFTELLLAQPVKRGSLFAGLYLGLTAPLVIALIGGVGLPFLMHGVQGHGAMLASLLGTGAALTMTFTALAFCIASWCEDRLRGMSVAIAVWMLAAILYDGIVLMVVAALADYPVERPILALTLANPIDLARVALLLQLDVSALMGYTGAVFQQFLGSFVGTLIAATALLLWIAAPVTVGMRAFERRDF
jgi:Cu-processing system permease protein